MKKTSFNTGWTCNGQPVTLPHDAMIHEKRDAKNPSGSAQAFFPGGAYVYEKTFTAPEGFENGHLVLEFEGVYKNARVSVNGKPAGGTAYGYIPFFINLDGLLKAGENVIRVECENRDQPDSRWYSGAGIYRPVWLWQVPAESIEPESVKISTVTIDPAVIRVQSPKPVTVEVEDISGEGTDFTLTIPNAKLWSAETPNLYTAHVTSGADSQDIPFGIRQITWDNKGLYVNGVPTLLRGGCVHHDSGILGAATYDEAEYRRVKMLKAAGFNAIRSSHNPCSRALLDACDKLGVYVMDEAWDMWYNHKNKYDYASQWRENYRSDLRAMVDRDYNHPSVILYSIGNEVSEPARDEGVEAAREMVSLLHEADPTRPVTGGFNLMIIASAKKGKGVYDEEGGGRDESGDKAMAGMNSTLFNMVTNMVGTGMNKSANSKKADEAVSPVMDALDICGYNYASGRYPLDGKLHPDRLIFGSETFPQDIAKNWEMVKKYPYLIGDFMWTAWDYLGEAGLGAWGYTPDSKGFNKPYPWLLADTGAMDILGDPNGELFLAQAAWGHLDAPKIAVQPINHDSKPAKMVWRGTNAIPSWSWRGCEGKKAVIEIYSCEPIVELFQDGKSLGRKKTKLCKAVFKTAYHPGRLEAVSFDASGREMGRSILTSADGALRLTVAPEVLEAGTGEIVYIPVSITDADGVVESNADSAAAVTVEGGELLAFGSANPRTEERFDAGKYTTYYGRALAVVRMGVGDLTVTASDGKMSASAVIKHK